MKLLICIPTYNEVENIRPLIEQIFALELGIELLVIDDHSPDGTAAMVRELMKIYTGLNLIERPGKQGLSSAYLAGFKYGLDRDFDFIAEMDADFSHDPVALTDILKLLKSGRYDFVIGSRYVPGGKTVNWGILRKIISRAGSLYARVILRVPINDLTGGFNFWSRQSLAVIGLDRIISEGYVFQIELKARACKGGMRFIEHPIIFEDRRVGKSKMNNKIFFEAMYKVIILRFSL